MDKNNQQELRRMITDIIKSELDARERSKSDFRKWVKFDSVTDKFSPITGNSQNIGFFGKTKTGQPTTSVASATFVANSGTAVNNASTFDGYTIQQVVKALRNLGLLQ